MINFVRMIIEQIKGTHKAAFNSPFELSFDERGLRVRRLTFLNRAEEHSLLWREIISAKAYKRDLLTVDRVCIAFEKATGEWFEINEDMKGWLALLPEMKINLEGFLPMEEWLGNVTLPPFQTNEIEIYRRNNE